MPADNIAEVLRTAHEAVKASGVPAGLHVAAFEKAVDLLAAEAGIAPVAALPTAPTSGSPRPPAPSRAGGAEEKTLDRIAEKLKVSTEAVSEVYYLDGDNLQISLAKSRFASEDAKAAQEISLLVAAARQAGGWDAGWTETSEIRRICQEKGKLDSPNFATAVRRMGDVFGFSGSRTTLKVQVNREGKAKAAALILRLSGGDQEAA